jgi:hypothetical protein
MRPRVLAAVVLGALVAVPIAGCDRPTPPGDVTPATTNPATRLPSQGTRSSSAPLAPVTPAGTSGQGGFTEDAAVPCAGRPGADQILLLVRRSLNMPANANLTVRTGPLCAGTWQYSVVVQPDVDPLQVVTRGAPGALTLVTAGTDVCTADVRAAAPPGITAAAHC